MSILTIEVHGMDEALLARPNLFALGRHRSRSLLYASLLKDSGLSMTAISSLVGYQDYNTFLRAFKKKFELSPRAVVHGSRLVEAKRVAELDYSRDFLRVLAKSVWREIRSHPREEWPSLVQEVRFGSTELFEYLCEASREEGRRDRHLGIDIMKVALRSLEVNSPRMSAPLSSLFALALARLGNARRLALDYDGAERDFQLANEYLELAHGEAGTAAEVLWLMGALRLHQRRFKEAQSCLGKAIGLCRVSNRTDLEIRCVVLRSKLYAHMGRSAEAVSSLLRMAESVDQIEEPRLRASFYSTLANGYAWSGDFANAFDAAGVAESCLENLDDPLGKLQLMWLRGTASYERGDRGIAARLLDAAYNGFIGLGEYDHAAVVAMELAAIRLHEGMVGEAISLASESLRVFRRLRILPEALAAERLLTNAISKRNLTFHDIDEIRGHLRRIISGDLTL